MKKWRRDVADVVARLVAALQPDDVVLGGGNAKKLKTLPRVAGWATMPRLFRRLAALGGETGGYVPP